MALTAVSHSGKRTSNVRWILVLVMCVVSFISYILRTNLSAVGDRMMTDLGLTQIQFGMVLSAFAWGYGIFQFPGGILGDIFGSRKSLTIAALFWGVLTILTGLTPGRTVLSVSLILGILIVIRFLVGATHAPLFPIIGGTIGNWFPVSGWALPNGLTSTALNLGAAAAVPLIIWLMTISGWRGSFFLTAPLGFFAATLWWRCVRDFPVEHSGVSQAELDLIDADRPSPRDPAEEKGVWKKVLKNRNVLLLTLSYFCMNYFFYLVFNWFFIYLVQVRGVPEKEAGYLTSSQYIVGSIGATLGGYFCDRFAKRFGPRWGYRLLPVPCLILSSALVIGGAMVKNSYAAVALLALCSGLTQVTDPIYWGAIVSVAGRHASAASGVLNTGGNVVGGIGAIIVPLIAKYFGWIVAIGSGAIFTFAAALIWLFIRADEEMSASK
jgi:MFS transporter, ACS family, glucarate transporter